MKHGRMKSCFAPAATVRMQSPLCLFARRMSTEVTPRSKFGEGEECVSVFTLKQKLLSVSGSCVGSVRGACLQSARGVRA